MPGFWSYLGFSDNEISKDGANEELLKPDVEHKLALDLLRITMLVYNYGKNLSIKEDTTIESFVSGNQSEGGINSMEKYAIGSLILKLICKLVLHYQKKTNELVLFLEEVNLGLTGTMIL